MAGGVPSVNLNSGHKMPVIGFGTGVPNATRELSEVFVDAIEVGYRHFDTAAAYGTEDPLGRAVAEAVKLGLIGSREDLFLTSKLQCADAHPDLVLPALRKSLSNLGLDYLDLYLIHWPMRLREGATKAPYDDEDFLPFDMRSTWEAMEECQRLGLVKSIGVSNFSSKKLSQLFEHASIPPAVNQVEMNVAWHQKKLREFCVEKSVHITAWSPLGAYGSSWGSPAVMQSPVVKEIADARNKTIAQVALRWVYEQGVSMAVKSYDRERMMQNLQIFDWELNEEDRTKIENIPQRKGFQGDMFVSAKGPYKSIQELWDGEI